MYKDDFIAMEKSANQCKRRECSWFLLFWESLYFILKVCSNYECKYFLLFSIFLVSIGRPEISVPNACSFNLSKLFLLKLELKLVYTFKPSCIYSFYVLKKTFFFMYYLS